MQLGRDWVLALMPDLPTNLGLIDPSVTVATPRQHAAMALRLLACLSLPQPLGLPGLGQSDPLLGCEHLRLP